MPDTGLYDEADSYDGGGASSYDTTSVPAKQVLVANLHYPLWTASLLYLTFGDNLPYVKLNNSLPYPTTYTQNLHYPHYTESLPMEVTD